MKHLTGRAESAVQAPQAKCFDLLADLEGYPRWYPETVKRVAVRERDEAGRVVQAEATLAAALGPIARDFVITLAVGMTEPESILLERVPHQPSDPERFEVRWGITPNGAETSTISVELEADLSVPRLVPTTGVGERMASGFLEAAQRTLEDDGR